MTEPTAIPKYNPIEVGEKWQKHWQDTGIYRCANPGEPGFDPSKPKYYVLDMFPYPSGSGLHVGHALGYIATDIIARKKRMEGFHVLHPMGWDAFGLPAEQYAIQTGTHPSLSTAKNCENFRRQLKMLGLSYDWNREINTSDPKYFRWTQEMFLLLYERGLVYQKEEYVWWCEELKTVLANEEVINGRSERGNFPCERKPLKQWMIKITAYADRLLDDLDLLNWPESVKKMQRDWIGKSEGLLLTFAVADSKEPISIFTTRAETIFGVTAMVLAPEHPFITKEVYPVNSEVARYVDEAKVKSERERKAESKTFSGAFTGLYAINPYLDPSSPKARVPIFVADYVLASYGTGAVMCVPAHDERDFIFAQAMKLPVLTVISGGTPEAVHEGDGLLENSEFLNGLTVIDARKKAMVFAESKKIGKTTIQYKLRDWLFSRQRYWGEPIPLIQDEKGNTYTVPHSELPITLPDISDFAPGEDGSSPLMRATDWVKYPSKDGKSLKRVTDTMPGWAGSCWYFLRFMDPHCETRFGSESAVNYWREVDLYVGGISHATMHLLYARFWHKVLFDAGWVNYPEPFRKLFNQGMVTAYAFKDATGRLIPSDKVEQKGSDWVQKENQQPAIRFVGKMAKSLRNVVTPDEVIQKYGVDTLRIYEMFLGPLEAEKPWADEGISGCSRFLSRLWNAYIKEDGMARSWPAVSQAGKDSKVATEMNREINRCLLRVNESFDNFNFNTAIAAGMEFINFLLPNIEYFTKAQAESFVLMMSPFAPHLCEELWQRMGHSESLSYHAWPKLDEAALVVNSIEIVILKDGKLRKRVTVPVNMAQDAMKELALKELGAQLEGATVKNIVVVPNKLVNVVTGK